MKRYIPPLTLSLLCFFAAAMPAAAEESIPTAVEKTPADKTATAAEAGKTAAAGEEKTKEVDLLFDLIFRVKNRDNKDPKATPKVQIAGFPYIGYTPATSLLIGIAGNVAWFSGSPGTTSLSAATAAVSLTLRKQLLISLKSVIYTPDNRLQLQGEWRFNLTNQDTWGVGPMQNTDKIDLLDFNLARFYETAYLQVVKGFYVGLGFNCDYFFSIVDHNARAGKPSMMQDYYGGRNVTQERSIGLSLGLMFDSRDNQINPKKGMYANASFRVSPKAFGSDDTWEQFWGEFRAYPRLGGENILAIWVWTWFTFGNVPYLSLPAIGWDTFNRSGRGFTQGRIRSNDMIYMEVEYRIKLMKNDLIGMVVFVNGTAASDPGTNSFTTVSPAGGAGLRVKLNRISETNLAIDAAIGDRLSYGLFMAVQEAF